MISLVLSTALYSTAQNVDLKFYKDAAISDGNGGFNMIKPAAAVLSTAMSLRVGRVEFELSIDGAESSNRVVEQDTLFIIVKVKNPKELPSEVINFYRLSKDNNRRFVKFISTAKSDDVIKTYDYDIYGDDSIILKVYGLMPGEYLVWYESDYTRRSYMGDVYVSQFGIDSK